MKENDGFSDLTLPSAYEVQGSSLFSRSVVSHSATSWTAARQASLSITNSRSLLKLMSIESVLPGTILRGSGDSFN